MQTRPQPAQGRCRPLLYKQVPGAGGGISPPRSRRPRPASLAPLATGTVQTITISRHFTAEQTGEKARNRPPDKLKYNQLTTSLQTGKGDRATTTSQINKHCSCGASSSPERPSVRPPHPPPSSTRDPERHPSSIIRLQRSVRPAQVITLQTHRARRHPQSSLAAASRCPFLPVPSVLPHQLLTKWGPPSRASAPQHREPEGKVAGGAEGGGACRDPRLWSPFPRARWSQLYRRRASGVRPRRAPPAPAHTRARTTRSPAVRPAAVAAARRAPAALPEPRAPDSSARRGRGARKPLCTVSAGHKFVPRLPGAWALREQNAERAEEEGEREAPRGEKSGEKCEKKQQSLHPRPEKWPAASLPAALSRGCGGGRG
ncbi:uncharacterized protein LOC106145065 [Ictidomys tridecemlineatus]